MRRSASFLWLLTTGLILTGGACHSLTSFHSPVKAQLPDRWTGGPVVETSAATGWLHDFQSPELHRLVEVAVGRNYDLQTAVARVRQARARAAIAGAARLPEISAGLDASRSQNLRGSAFDKVTANQFSAGLDLVWELDLWGRLLDLQDAALAEWGATEADYVAARLSLAASIVSTALDLLEAELQGDVARNTLKSLRTNLEILDARLELGDVDDRTALEITLSRADVLRAEANLEASRRRADAARRLLQTLTGAYPDGLIEGIEAFPQVKREVPAGLPSELLLRRPDLVAAERRVVAAMHETSAAWKALLPSFRITGGTGTSTTQDFSDLLDEKALVWNLAGSLSQAVFQGGRLKATARLSEARTEELAALYAETALTAFRDVETALAGEAFFKSQQEKLAAAVEETDLAERLALGQYEQGLVDIITVLESQRRSFDARSTLLAITNERLQNRLNLYLALGGDFDHVPPVIR